MQSTRPKTNQKPVSTSAGPKNANARAIATENVEFDAKHVDSPLCACKACNDEWLAKRNQPLSMKRAKQAAPPIDLANQKPMTARCKKLGIELQLKNEHNLRIAHWRLVDKATEYTSSLGFDTDVLGVLDRMESRGLSLQAAVADLLAPRDPGPVRSSSLGSLTGGPFCVVCDTAGGLPCPAMVRDALKLGIKLAYPPGDARLVPNHVHPGRCRKRLKAWIAGGTQAATGKAPTT
jgi:hypothetical protein